MQILDHNLKAYKALIKSFKKANRACIVHPTGLGKSYIAYQLIADNPDSAFLVFNIGTGTPYSVLDIINTFEKVNGVKVNYEIGPRRAGDLPEVWANVDKANNVLGWKAERTLEDMCRDAWNWQVNNPNGYE